MTHIAMLLSNEYRPDPRVARSALALEEIGYQISLICWDRSGQGPKTAIQDGISIIRIDTVRSSYGAGVRQILHLPRFWHAAVRLLGQIKPDVVHCHDLDTLPAGWWYCKQGQTPLVFDAHEDYPALMSLYLPGMLITGLSWLEGRLIKKTSAVITASTVLADKYRRRGISNILTIGNYPDLEPYRQLIEDQIQTARTDLGLVQNDLVVGYIGGFSRNRQLAPLLAAASGMPEVQFVIWGDGHQRALVEDAAAQLPNVHYPGWLNPQLIPLYASAVDCLYYCLVADYPGAIYNAPNSLAIAMAAGRPLIANNVGDLGQIIKETGCGLLLDEVSPAHIQGAIQQLKSAQLRSQLGMAGKKAASECYNWSTTSTNLQMLYRNILKPGFD